MATLLAAMGCIGNASLGAEHAAPAAPAGPDLSRMAAGMDAVVVPVSMDSGVDSGLAAVPDAGDALSPLGLEFRVSGAKVSELRISCPDTCGSVEVAAHGGVPPYVLQWSDATSDVQRRLCPASDTTLSVVVSDARGVSQSGRLDVRLASCTPGQLCATNGSFEGTPTFGAGWFRAEFDATPWDDCHASNTDARTSLPKVVDQTSGDEFPAASDGKSYVYLGWNPPLHEYLGQTLCAPLHVGTAYSFKIDLAEAAESSSGATLGQAQLEVYASSGACERDELLWTSAPLKTAWRTYCLTLKPSREATALVLNPIGPAMQSSAVFVDHLIAVDSCP